MNLWNITKEYQDIRNELEESGGELTDRIFILLDETDENIKVKLQNCVNVVKSYDMEVEAAKKEIERLTKLKKSKENARDNFKQYMLNCIKKTEETKFNLENVTVSIRKNAIKPDYTNEDKINDKFKETVPETKKVVKKLMTDSYKERLKDIEKIKDEMLKAHSEALLVNEFKNQGVEFIRSESLTIK